MNRNRRENNKLRWIFLLLPFKVHADVITDWQYWRAKIATKSEMYVKYGHAICFGDKYEYKHSL